MPLIEYGCTDCKKRFTLLVGMVAEREDEKCPTCGSVKINRMMSRFSRIRSDDALIDDLADPSKIGDLDDPKQLQSWMKDLSREVGEDLGGDFDQMIEEAASPDVSDAY